MSDKLKKDLTHRGFANRTEAGRGSRGATSGTHSTLTLQILQYSVLESWYCKLIYQIVVDNARMIDICEANGIVIIEMTEFVVKNLYDQTVKYFMILKNL